MSQVQQRSSKLASILASLTTPQKKAPLSPTRAIHQAKKLPFAFLPTT